MNIGDLVDDFALPATDGEFRLSAFRGRAVALYFYPKDDTPGCTLEGREFSELLGDFAAANAEIAGISPDSVADHNAFCAKHRYAHRLLSDADGSLCARFGTDKTADGQPAKYIARSTFLIDKTGRLARAWRNIQNAEGHAAEVLAAARELQ